MADRLANSTSLASVGIIGLGFLIVAFRAASSIGEEKDRDCWISLLATPVTARQIIYSKAIGAFSTLQFYILLLAPLLILALAYGALSLAGLVYWMAGVLSYGFAIACLGVHQSLWQKTTIRAMTFTIVITAILGGVAQMFLLPVIIWQETNLYIAASLPWTPLSLASHLDQITPRNDEILKIVVLSLFFMIGYVGVGFVLLSQCMHSFGRATGRLET